MERNASWEQYNLKNVDLWFEVIRYEGRMINFELEVKNWVRMINFELKTEFELFSLKLTIPSPAGPLSEFTFEVNFSKLRPTNFEVCRIEV